VPHLLVTNDFPPKVGGIQSYLWDLWRNLDPAEFVVLTAASHPEAASFDEMAAKSGIRVRRSSSRVLLPSPRVHREVVALLGETGAGLVMLDPALPLGLLGPALGVPYGLVLHGAEVTLPARLPVSRGVLRRVVRQARLLVCAGGYPAEEARRLVGASMPPSVVIPPGVDSERFKPLDEREKAAARSSLSLPAEGPLVVSVSRLVPRKGMDVLIQAASALSASFPDLTVAIGGEGRDRRRLESMARACAARVVFLGRVADEWLPRLYGAADIFVMACRNRWGGLEQEGFGMVFLEAASCGVPQVAGRSGGAPEAVVAGETGFVIEHPKEPAPLAAALRRLLADEGLRRRLGEASRRRALESFNHGLLARRLSAAIKEAGG